MSDREWLCWRKAATGGGTIVSPSHWMRWLSQVCRTATWASLIVGAALVINVVAVRPGSAQAPTLLPPEYALTDENDVDLLSFRPTLHLTDLSIGAKEAPLTQTIYPVGSAWTGGSSSYPVGIIIDQFRWTYLQCQGNCTNPQCSTNATYVRVAFGNSSETFQYCDLLPDGPTGSALTNPADNSWHYTKRDGTIVIYCCGNTGGAPRQILYPDGRVLTYWYCADGPGSQSICSVTRSDGFQLKYNYAQTPSGFWCVTSTTAINNAYEYCTPTTSASCSLTMTWPTANYAATVPSPGLVTFTVTDAAGRVTRYTEANTGTPAGLRTIGIKLPSSASADNITYTYCDNNCPQYTFETGVHYQDYVLNVTRDGQTWSYSGNPGSPTLTKCGTATFGFTNPVGSGKQATLTNCLPNTQGGAFAGILPAGATSLIQLTDEQGVKYIADNSMLIQRVVKPEGNQVSYSWDVRGNLTQVTLVPKSGSPPPGSPSLSQETQTASYDTTCTNQLTCNKPHWIKDALGNETDYTYDPTHGGMLTKTLPPDANGIRPQTRYTYTQRYARILNSSRAYVPSAAPIWVMATESFCRTSPAAPSGTGCTQAGDEVIKTYEYGPDTGPNNLFLRGVAVTADGVTHRTCYGYDMYGNKISETEPDAGLTSCP